MIAELARKRWKLDIQTVSYDELGKLIRAARAIVWNGPMGAFETPPFDTGTRAVAEAVAAAAGAGATSVIGAVPSP